MDMQSRGRTLLVRPKNCFEAFVCESNDHYDLLWDDWQSLSFDKVQSGKTSVKRLMLIKERFKLIGVERPMQMMRLRWVYAAQTKLPLELWAKEILPVLEDVIAGSCETAALQAKIQKIHNVCVIENCCLQSDLAKKYLLPHLDRHFGLLAEVVQTLEDHVPNFQPSRILRMKIETLKTEDCAYNDQGPGFESDKPIMREAVSTINDAMEFQVLGAKTFPSHMRRRLRGALKNLTKSKDLARHTARFVNTIESLLAYGDKDYVTAMKSIEKNEKLSDNQSLWDNMSCRASLLILKIWTFIRMNEKTRAKKCFKILKRMKSVSNLKRSDLKILEKKVGKMKNEKKIGQPVFRARCKQRCAQPHCNRKESKIGEFMLCSKCRLVAYCGYECQKKHWKMSHKHSCGK